MNSKWNFTQIIIDKMCDADHCHSKTDNRGRKLRETITLEDAERMHKLSKHYEDDRKINR